MRSLSILQMELHDICTFVKTCSNTKIDLTQQFEKKALGRKYHAGQVKDIICQNNLVGVWDQGDGSFRLWFEHTDEHDAVVAARIIDGKMRPITIYPQTVDKRKRMPK